MSLLAGDATNVLVCHWHLAAGCNCRHGRICVLNRPTARAAIREAIVFDYILRECLGQAVAVITENWVEVGNGRAAIPIL